MRRSRLEICIDILKAVGEGKTKFTRVMYDSNTSWQVLQENLQYLIKAGFISTQQVGARKIYRLTQEGIILINDFREIEKAVPIVFEKRGTNYNSLHRQTQTLATPRNQI